MAHFQFEVLSDKEFEVLIADLLGEYFGTRIQRFKPGKDEGVDGRFYHLNKEVIIQCKQCSTNFSQLKRVLTKEVKNLIILKPSRYILATSLHLSKKNKIDVLKIFNGFNLAEEDIFGQEDLTDLLDKNPTVLKRHFKLWLTSASVLETIHNHDIYGRSIFKIGEITENLKFYVQTSNHDIAIQKLESTQCLIITGIPGIGKSTLAENICLYFIGLDFDFIQIHDSIEEAERTYAPERKQIFYFDDFLGRTHLYQIKNNEDNKTVNFIKRVLSDKKKRFVLTSRTNILNQGKRISDLFEINKIHKNEFELSITSLTALEKARILYNHIFFGNLPSDFINEFYKDHNYLKVIDHRNFNPRLIQFITDYERFEDIPRTEYWLELYRTLENPEKIWQHVFESQLDETSRHIVVGLALYGKSMPDELFLHFISEIFKTFSKADQSLSIQSYLKVLIDSLITRNTTFFDTIEYNLYNPSIADFVNNYYLSSISYISDLVYCINNRQVTSNLNSLYYGKKISVEQRTQIAISVLKKQLIGRGNEGLNSFVISLVKILSEAELASFQELLVFMDLHLNNWIEDERILTVDQFEFLDQISYFERFNYIPKKFETKSVESLNNGNFDQDELETIGSYIHFQGSDQEKETYHQISFDYYKDSITEILINNSILDDFFYEDEPPYSKVITYLNETGIYSCDFSIHELNEIWENVDLGEISNTNTEASSDYRPEPTSQNITSSDIDNEKEAIHDLFEKTNSE